VRDQDRALISHYDWDRNLNGTVASAQAALFTDGTYAFVLLEGPNCFGSPTPTVTSTPDQTCKSQNGQYTRICAVIDLKSCKQNQLWVFTIAPQFFEPEFPDTIVVNFSDGSSTSLSGSGQYRDGDRIWRDYPDYTRHPAQPGAAWASVLTALNDSFGYVFKLKSGPGCHGLGEGETGTITATPTGTVTATLSPNAPSATPPLTRTPYPTYPARTPTPPVGTLPATGAGDAGTSAGMMTLLALAAVVALGLVIRRRNTPG
jgi:MYXO-CTERM domain-containing protein